MDDLHSSVTDLVCLDDSFITMVIPESLMLFIYVHVQVYCTQWYMKWNSTKYKVIYLHCISIYIYIYGIVGIIHLYECGIVKFHGGKRFTVEDEPLSSPRLWILTRDAVFMKNTKYIVMYLHVHFIPTWYCMYMNHWYCWLIFDWQGSGDSILGVWEWEDGQSVLIEEVGDFLISGNTSLISLHVQRVKLNWILCLMHLKFLLHAIKMNLFFIFKHLESLKGKSPVMEISFFH